VLCIEPGCGRPILNRPRKLCSAHYQRLRRRGLLLPLETRPLRHPPLERRVFDRIAWPSSWLACWRWPEPLDGKGYGTVSVDGRGRRAHRVVYEMFIGLIAEGLELDHRCRRTSCVNPLHLEPVTHAENMRRGIGGWNHRVKTHCPQGHPYAGANLYINKTSGARVCRTCTNEKQRRYQERKRAAAAGAVAVTS
jgi:hypothetical protein